MKILLIGGSGYIGTVISNYFVNKSSNIHIFDNFIYDNREHLNTFYKNLNISLYSNNFSNLIIENNYDLIVILSGLVGDPITKKYPSLSKLHNNYEIKNYLNFINSNYKKKLVFVSTCSNYGLTDGDTLLDENSVLNPLSLYAKDKVAIENYLLENKWNFHFTILRFATAFGHSPRMRFDLTVNEFIKLFYFKKSFEVYDSDTWRPYCHTTDFARAIEAILFADKNKISKQIFNVGSNENNFTKRAIVEKINEFFESDLVTYRERGMDQRNYKVNFSKINDILNFKPQVSLTVGVKEIIKNLKSNLYKNIHNEYLYGNHFINNDQNQT